MDFITFSSSSPPSSRNNSFSSEPLRAATQDSVNFSNPFSFLGANNPRDLITKAMERSDQHQGQQDSRVAFGNVLSGLEPIWNHLRQNGSNTPANEIAKHAISMAKIFNVATADWNDENYWMSAPQARQDDRDWNGGAVSPRTTKATVSAGLAEEAQDSTKSKAVELDTQASTIETGSWAAVAATATDANNQIVKFRPKDGRTYNVPDTPTTLIASNVPDPDDNGRVIWIRPWNQHRRPLSDITEKIVQGPIFSIKHSAADEGVCIIFQHADSARRLLEADAQCKDLRGEGLFGSLCELIEGEPFGENKDLLRMETKMERRRLTFARKGLFTNGVTEAKFRKEIFKMVGEPNVERIWLFNGGNATVVLLSTIIARTVLQGFMGRSGSPGPYQGVLVTFSHDPCERPLHLTSQLSGVRNPFVGRLSRSFDGPSGHDSTLPHPQAPPPSHTPRNGVARPAQAKARPAPNSGNNRFGVLADNEWQLIAKRK